MARPFRFGVQVSSLPPQEWILRVRRIEELGFSSLFFPDHFGTQWEPTAGIAAAAAVSERLQVGSLVYDVDYRHPVVLAKTAATIHLISGGRHEFGIGAGWMESEYREAGIGFDRPGVRIERLEEAVAMGCIGRLAILQPHRTTVFAYQRFDVMRRTVPRDHQQVVLVAGVSDAGHRAYL